MSSPVKQEHIKQEITDFNKVYQNQPPDSVFIGDEKKSLNLDLENGNRQVWLVKLPRFLSQKLNDIEDIGGQEIGKLLLDKKAASLQADQMKFKLMLNNVAVDDADSDAISAASNGASDQLGFKHEAMAGFRPKKDFFQDLPHEYDLRVTDMAVKNAFVFSEENLEDYSKRKGVIGGGIQKPKPVKKEVKKELELDAEANLQFARTIPKKTALVGTVCHECSVTPSIKDPNYSKVLQKRRIQEVVRPDKPIIELIQKSSAPSLKSNDISNEAFIKANRVSSKDNRAIRMDRKELLDLLFALFDEYDYWSLKVIKEKIRQPDSWLKECLDSIAILSKKGPNAAKYCLKPEYKKLRDMERARASGAAVDDGSKDDDDDDEVEMLDVI